MVLRCNHFFPSFAGLFPFLAVEVVELCVAASFICELWLWHPALEKKNLNIYLCLVKKWQEKGRETALDSDGNYEKRA